MPNLACSAFLQTHARPLAVGTGAGVRLLPGTIISTAWRIDQELRRCDASITYSARYIPSGEPAAFTLFDVPALALASYRARMLTMAQMLATVEHPGVSDVIDVGLTADGRPYVITDLAEGTTLAERAQSCSLDLEQALSILRGICAPLIAAHEAGVSHGSLVADNVLIVDASALGIKLLDWGFERMLLEEAGRAGVSRAEPARCRAPEEACGVVSAKTDAYAFGLIAYELVTGHSPFEGKDIAEVRAQQQEVPDPRRHWPAIPSTLEALLRSLLAPSPCDRPLMRDVATQLAAISRIHTAPPAAKVEAAVTSSIQAPVVTAAATATPFMDNLYEVAREKYARTRSYVPAVAVAATAMAIVFATIAPSVLVKDEPVRTIASLAASTAAAPAASLTTPLPAAKSATPTATPQATAVSPTTSIAPAPAAPASAASTVATTRRAADPPSPARPTPRRVTATDRAPDKARLSEAARMEFLTRYQRVGRDLMQLKRRSSAPAIAEMWQKFSSLQIEHALASAKTRASASAVLDELREKIARNKGVAISDTCKSNPLADGCK